jgi:hypothetical protein
VAADADAREGDVSGWDAELEMVSTGSRVIWNENRESLESGWGLCNIRTDVRLCYRDQSLLLLALEA